MRKIGRFIKNWWWIPALAWAVREWGRDAAFGARTGAGLGPNGKGALIAVAVALFYGICVLYEIVWTRQRARIDRLGNQICAAERARIETENGL